jgi:hypothetical protein
VSQEPKASRALRGHKDRRVHLGRRVTKEIRVMRAHKGQRVPRDHPDHREHRAIRVTKATRVTQARPVSALCKPTEL